MVIKVDVQFRPEKEGTFSSVARCWIYPQEKANFELKLKGNARMPVCRIDLPRKENESKVYTLNVRFQNKTNVRKSFTVSNLTETPFDLICQPASWVCIVLKEEFLPFCRAGSKRKRMYNSFSKFETWKRAKSYFQD